MMVTVHIRDVEGDFDHWKKCRLATVLEIFTRRKGKAVGARGDGIVRRQQGLAPSVLIGPAFIHAFKLAAVVTL